MMEYSKSIQVDTKGLCLLCFRPSASLPPPLTNVSSAGFKTFLRYLRVNPSDLFNCSLSFLEAMEIKGDIDIQISLCSNCALVTQEFDRFYKEYELFQTRFKSCVETVYTSMSEGDRSPERVREYKRRMKPAKIGELVNASIAANLRNETFKMCSEKLDIKHNGCHFPKEKPFQPITSHPMVVPVAPMTPPPGPSYSTPGGSNSRKRGRPNPPKNNRHGPTRQFLRDVDLDHSVDQPHDYPDEDLNDGSFRQKCNYCTLILRKPEDIPTHTVLCHTFEHYSEQMAEGTSRLLFNKVLESLLATFMQVSSLSESVYECGFCNKQFTLEENCKHEFKIHLFVEHPINFVDMLKTQLEEALALDNDSSFSSSETESNHGDGESSGDVDPLMDTEPQPSTSKGVFTRAESPNPLAVCQLCNQHFPYENDVLFQHSLICEGGGGGDEGGDDDEVCDICHKKFRSKEELEEHVKTQHVKKFKCMYCGHDDPVRSNVTQHMIDKHLIEVTKKQMPAQFSKEVVDTTVKRLFEDMAKSKVKKCRICWEMVTPASQLQRHVTMTHFEEYLELVKKKLGIGSSGGSNDSRTNGSGHAKAGKTTPMDVDLNSMKVEKD